MAEGTDQVLGSCLVGVGSQWQDPWGQGSYIKRGDGDTHNFDQLYM